MVKAVLWDVDDTIFDYSGADRHAAVRHFAAEGLPCDQTALDRWREITNLEYARFVAGELTFEQQRRARARRYLEGGVTDAEADAWFARYLLHLEGAWAAFPDVAPALAALPLRHGVLSNSSTSLQERKLTTLGLRQHFEILICSAELGCAKPDPAAFLAGCAALGLPAGEVAYVGDLLDIDAVGALNAGLRAVWLDRSGSAATVPDGVHRISSLAELPTILDL